jgi:hypothetical protein
MPDDVELIAVELVLVADEVAAVTLLLDELGPVAPPPAPVDVDDPVPVDDASSPQLEASASDAMPNMTVTVTLLVRVMAPRFARAHDRALDHEGARAIPGSAHRNASSRRRSRWSGVPERQRLGSTKFRCAAISVARSRLTGSPIHHPRRSTSVCQAKTSSNSPDTKPARSLQVRPKLEPRRTS